MLLIINALLWTCPKNYCNHCERNSFSNLTYQCKHMSLVHMAFTDLCRDAVDGIAPLVHGQLVAYLHLPSLSFEPDNIKMSLRFAKCFTNKLVFTFQIMCKTRPSCLKACRWIVVLLSLFNAQLEILLTTPCTLGGALSDVQRFFAMRCAETFFTIYS